MNYLLDLLLYRHRRFKGQTYFKNHFPAMMFVSVIFALFIADSYVEFFMVVTFFTCVDALLAIGAWLYYPSDL